LTEIGAGGAGGLGGGTFSSNIGLYSSGLAQRFLPKIY
jgi:hypothetical protein